MKLSNVIATGAILIAIAFAPVLAHAQDVKQDKKEIRKDEDKKAANIAERNRAEKNGHPKQAVKDEKKVQQDNKDLHKDRKDLRKDKAARK